LLISTIAHRKKRRPGERLASTWTRHTVKRAFRSVPRRSFQLSLFLIFCSTSCFFIPPANSIFISYMSMSSWDVLSGLPGYS
jgi:hypothetical protein